MNGHPAVRLTDTTRVHLVGIGGSGMTALAQILLQRGLPTSGTDLRGGATADALRAAGAVVHIGHDAAHITGADLVVVSNAVPRDNPEWTAAVAAGIPVLLRADLLELLMAGTTRVLITGTHGKTTTTSMTTVALQACGLDPSFAIGGTLPGAGVSAGHGGGRVFVAEADEAFRSFLRLTPDVAVVTNLEMDHHDTYADLADYRDAFVAFLARRPEGALAVLCADDPGSGGLRNDVQDPVLTYGLDPIADVIITDVAPVDGGSTFRLVREGAAIGTFSIAAPGIHNVRNATAAILAAEAVGGSLDAIADGLAPFSGALRRFQRLGTAAGVAVVDDYGHHPTELEATIDAAVQANPHGRVIAIFQPHRYSRTQALGPALGRALARADQIIITDVYAASEAPIPGVDSTLVADGTRAAGGQVRVVGTLEEAADVVLGSAAAGDLVLTMGAGDITELGPRLLARLRERA